MVVAIENVIGERGIANFSENQITQMPGGGQSEREDKVSLELNEEILQSMENGRISSTDFHRTSKFLVAVSDDESIHLYDVSNATTVLLWDQRAEKCQGLLRLQGRPATAYDDQGLVFAIALGGYIRMFDVRQYAKGTFDIFSVGGDMSDANVVKYSNDGKRMLLTTMATTDGHIHVLDSFHGTLAASWMSTEAEPLVIKWAPGNLMFVTGSSELSFWIPDLSKLATYVGRK